jgi:hypothetical protein
MITAVFVLAFSLSTSSTLKASTDTELVIEKGLKLTKCGGDSDTTAKCGKAEVDSTTKCGSADSEEEDEDEDKCE